MVYKRKMTKTKCFVLIALSVLLVFCSCCAITGAWFSDHKTIVGDLEKPTFSFDLVDENGVTKEDVFYISPANSSDLSKVVNLKINSSNVDKLVVRAYVTQEWGTLNGDTFTPLEEQPSGGLKYTRTGWTRGYYFLLTDDMAEFGYTENDIEGGVWYYYNDIITSNSQINIIDGFTAKTGYNNLTAKITVTVEVAPASDTTLNVSWTQGDDFGGIQDGSPTEDWKTSIKNKR